MCVALGLEALERGGSELVNEVLRQAKVLLERRRVKKLKQNQQSAKVHDKERGSSSTEDFEQLQCGVIKKFELHVSLKAKKTDL